MITWEGQVPTIFPWYKELGQYWEYLTLYSSQLSTFLNWSPRTQSTADKCCNCVRPDQLCAEPVLHCSSGTTVHLCSSVVTGQCSGLNSHHQVPAAPGMRIQERGKREKLYISIFVVHQSTQNHYFVVVVKLTSLMGGRERGVDGDDAGEGRRLCFLKKWRWLQLVLAR